MTLYILFGVFFLTFFLCPALSIKVNGVKHNGLLYRIIAAAIFALLMLLIFDMPVLWLVSTLSH